MNWKQATGLSNLKSKSIQLTSASHCNSSLEPQDDSKLMDLKGEFAKDESAAMIKAVQASKAPGESSV